MYPSLVYCQKRVPLSKDFEICDMGRHVHERQLTRLVAKREFPTRDRQLEWARAFLGTRASYLYISKPRIFLNSAEGINTTILSRLRQNL